MTTQYITGSTGGIVLSAGDYTDPVTVTATGSVATSQGYGLSAATAWTIVNQGNIGSRYGGILLNQGGSVTNASSGTIVGHYDGVLMNGVGTVVNAGLIGGSGYYGVVLQSGGSVTNASGGTIITGGYVGVLMTGVGTVVNAGLILGNLHYGVELRSGGSVTNASSGTISGRYDGIKGGSTVQNAGTISGGQYYGVYLFSASNELVANAAGATIAGGYTGVCIREGGAVTVENGGTITGAAYSVYLGAATSHTLIVDAGAVFTGNVLARGTANTLELSSASGAGTISGFGSQYQGFQTIAIDSGAAWTVKGAASGFGGVTIGGFNTHDTLDLTGLAFAAGETATLNAATDLLTVANAGGTTLATVQLAGSFASLAFLAASDGAGGTDITHQPISQLSNAYAGIVLSGDSYTNPVTVTATGNIAGGGADGLYAASYWTVTNSGAISSTGGEGVDFEAGGVVSNAGGGSITGVDQGILIQGGTGAVDNSGGITGSNGTGVSMSGVYESVTNTASGKINGNVDGVIGTAGLVENLGAITGKKFGVFLKGGGAATVENGGTISGATNSVYLSASSSNTLIVDAGAVFTGAAVAANAAAINTLELSANNGPGTLKNVGSNIRGFTTIKFDAGAPWTVSGVAGAFNCNTVTIAGFTSNDVLDITNFGYVASDTATLNNNNLLLIRDKNGAFLGAVQFASTDSFTGEIFMIGKDAGTGTKITAVAVPTTSLRVLSSSNWNDVRNWSGGQVPNNTSLSVAITLNRPTAYNLYILKTQSYSVCNLTVDASMAHLVLQGSLTVAGNLTLTAGIIALQAGTLTGAVSVAAGSTIHGSGTINGAVANTGLIDASTGKLVLSGDVSGTGTLQIEASKTLELGGNAAGQTINFALAAGPHETLILDQPGDSFGTITGFALTDKIDLKGIIGTTATFSGGVLTVMNGTATVATLSFAGGFAGQHFKLAGDGGSGTNVTLASGAKTTPTFSNHQLALFSQAVAGYSHTLSAMGEIAAMHRSPDSALGVIATSFHH